MILRHFPRRTITGNIEIVDRQFDFVRAILPYDYQFTCNAQQWSEAERICQALEGPMISQGVASAYSVRMRDDSLGADFPTRQRQNCTSGLHEGVPFPLRKPLERDAEPEMPGQRLSHFCLRRPIRFARAMFSHINLLTFESARPNPKRRAVQCP